MVAPAPEATEAVQEFDPETSEMQAAEAPGEEISLTRIYEGLDGFKQLIEEFSGGSRAFAIDDFRQSYSPAQWSELRQQLAAAKFRGARVFLQVELSDEMKQYLGASTARAEVPSVILE
jgi:hypothetical protein